MLLLNCLCNVLKEIDEVHVKSQKGMVATVGIRVSIGENIFENIINKTFTSA